MNTFAANYTQNALWNQTLSLLNAANVFKGSNIQGYADMMPSKFSLEQARLELFKSTLGVVEPTQLQWPLLFFNPLMTPAFQVPPLTTTQQPIALPMPLYSTPFESFINDDVALEQMTTKEKQSPETQTSVSRSRRPKQYRKRELSVRLERLQKRKEKKSNRERARRIEIHDLFLVLKAKLDAINGIQNDVVPKNRGDILADLLIVLNEKFNIPFAALTREDEETCNLSDTPMTVSSLKGETNEEILKKVKKSRKEKQRRQSAKYLTLTAGRMLGCDQYKDKLVVLRAANAFLSDVAVV